MTIPEGLFEELSYESTYLHYYAERAGYEEIYERDPPKPITFTDEKGRRGASFGRTTIGSRWRPREHAGQGRRRSS